jgi:nucleotide-binding universal stress UspA family protein
VSNQVKPYGILAAVSFDETGDYALREAVRIAEQNESAELHVVHVIEESLGHEGDGDALASVEVPKELSRRVSAVWAKRQLKITAHIRLGNPARSILQTAGDLDADLIVVGAHRRTGIQKLVMGSVGEQVLRDAHCGVLVAMPKDHIGAAATARIEPPCADCVAARTASRNAQYWCERHSRSRLRPHVYEPSDSRPAGSVP